MQGEVPTVEARAEYVTLSLSPMEPHQSYLSSHYPDILWDPGEENESGSSPASSSSKSESSSLASLSSDSDDLFSIGEPTGLALEGESRGKRNKSISTNR